MFIISYNVDGTAIDNKVESLEINDIFDFYYENPLEITVDQYGYGYEEKNNETMTLNVVYYGEELGLNEFISKVDNILELPHISIVENNEDYTTFEFPTIELDDKWVLCAPGAEIEGRNNINFISQGAFGTGLHETTQDLLRIILNKLNFKNKSVLDIGTGSGILSMAASIAGASEVTAVDIRDVKDEVELNSSLNNLQNIKVVVGNILDDESLVSQNFDTIIINIGGEETKFFMDFINKHLHKDGLLIVSGLVEWSFEEVKSSVTKYGFELEDKYQSAEWVTATFIRS